MMNQSPDDLLEQADFSVAGVAEAVEQRILTLGETEETDYRLSRLARSVAAAGRWSSALTIARSIRSFLDRAGALSALAALRVDSGQQAQAVGLAMEAEAAARACSTDWACPNPTFAGDRWVGWTTATVWQKAQMLCRIALQLGRAGEIDQAKRIWDDAVSMARLGEASESPQDSLDSSSVLWEIAEALATVGEFQRAEEVADEIKSPGKRTRALAGVAAVANGESSSFTGQWCR